MRNSPWLRDLSGYPLQYEITTGYRDLDILAHVNNIAMAGYYDTARERMTRQIFTDLPPHTKGRIVTAESRVAYLAEVLHPSTVIIGAGITKIGNSSFEIGQAAFVDGACAGVCLTTLVRTAEPGADRSLAPELRAALEALLIKQP
jgi:acyl-CoA thioester hydrolase